MTYLAFTYADYYCHGIKDSFRGTFNDKHDLLIRVKGDRYDFRNLEILDTDTLGIERYWWNARFKERTEYETNEDGSQSAKHFLKDDWIPADLVGDFEIKYEEGRRQWDRDMEYEYGYWDHNDPSD